MQTYLIVPDQGKKGSSKTYVKSSIREAVPWAFAKPVLKGRAKMGEVLIAGAIEYFGGCGFAGLQEGPGPFQFFLLKPIAGRVLKNFGEASFESRYAHIAEKGQFFQVEVSIFIDLHSVLKREVAVLFQRILQEGNKLISIGIDQVDHDLFELDLQ